MTLCGHGGYISSGTQGRGHSSMGNRLFQIYRPNEIHIVQLYYLSYKLVHEKMYMVLFW